LEQGFNPRRSQVTAGICFLLFLGLLDYLFGLRKLLGLLLLFVPLVLLFLFLFPKSPWVSRIAHFVGRALDPGNTPDWLEERFEKPTRS
jgi:hypothetical protein